MKKLDDLGIALPPPTAAVGSYLPVVRAGNLVFVSGHIAKKEGKVGAEAVPTRTSFGVAELPMGACVEIDLIAEAD